MRPSPPKRPRPQPDIRINPAGTSVLIDDIDRYARSVVGLPPHNFEELVGFVRDLGPVLREICGVDEGEARTVEQIRDDNDRLRDTLLLAAWAITETANEGAGENPSAFVQRAKQVIAWCEPKTSALTPLDELENKNRELGRLIGMRLARHEGFILTIFDHGIDDKQRGNSTWITSVGRRQGIEMLGELLAHMKEDQDARS